MRNYASFTIVLTSLVIIAVFTGCGSSDKGVKVKGKVLLEGKPLEAPRKNVGLGYIEVRLIPESAKGAEREAGQVLEDGSFEVIGAGSGVKPGTYKLAVVQMDGPHSKMLEEKFSEKTTPIKVSISEDKLGDTMDLGTIELSNPPSSL